MGFSSDGLRLSQPCEPRCATFLHENRWSLIRSMSMIKGEHVLPPQPQEHVRHAHTNVLNKAIPSSSGTVSPLSTTLVTCYNRVVMCAMLAWGWMFAPYGKWKHLTYRSVRVIEGQNNWRVEPQFDPIQTANRLLWGRKCHRLITVQLLMCVYISMDIYIYIYIYLWPPPFCDPYFWPNCVSPQV